MVGSLWQIIKASPESAGLSVWLLIVKVLKPDSQLAASAAREMHYQEFAQSPSAEWQDVRAHPNEQPLGTLMRSYRIFFAVR